MYINAYKLFDLFFLKAIIVEIIKSISNTNAIYDLYTSAYINQHIADTIPILLISFSLFVKNAIIEIHDANIGKIE